MTVTMEERRSKMTRDDDFMNTSQKENNENSHEHGLYIKHYLYYSVVRILSRPLFTLVGYGIIQYTTKRDDDFTSAFVWTNRVFVLLSLYIVFHMTCLLKELKVRSISKEARQFCE